MRPPTPLRRTLRWILFPALVALILLAATGGGWTKALAVGDEWRPVDPSELVLKTQVIDPDADVEVLFWGIRVEDGGEDDLVL